MLLLLMFGNNHRLSLFFIGIYAAAGGPISQSKKVYYIRSQRNALCRPRLAYMRYIGA